MLAVLVTQTKLARPAARKLKGAADTVSPIPVAPVQAGPGLRRFVAAVAPTTNQRQRVAAWLAKER